MLLLMVLDRALTMSVADVDELPWVRASGSQFTEVLRPGVGLRTFQDWLVDPHGTPVGVRITVTGDESDFERMVPARPYIERHVPGLMSFWFGAPTELDEEASTTQDFHPVSLLSSPDGRMMIAISMEPLSATERAGIEAKCAR